MKRKSVISVDFDVDSNWEFYIPFKKKGWELDIKISNRFHKSHFSNLKRYLIYFFHGFSLFVKRRKFENILFWQQFYGIFFCFFCSLFFCKKKINVNILTFIYKEKKGFIGKLYKFLIYKALKCKMLNKVFVLSTYEVSKYAKLFPKCCDKFVFAKLGVNSTVLSELHENDYIISAGRSNRDYDFLIKVMRKSKIPMCYIVSDAFKADNLPSNVVILSNMYGLDYYKMLSNSKLVVVSLSDEPISSGQLVILDAMKYEKVVLSTYNAGVLDYINSGVNGYICKKDEDLFLSILEELYFDDLLRSKIKKSIGFNTEEKYGEYIFNHIF